MGPKNRRAEIAMENQGTKMYALWQQAMRPNELRQSRIRAAVTIQHATTNFEPHRFCTRVWNETARHAGVCNVTALIGQKGKRGNIVIIGVRKTRNLRKHNVSPQHLEAWNSKICNATNHNRPIPYIAQTTIVEAIKIDKYKKETTSSY